MYFSVRILSFASNLTNYGPLFIDNATIEYGFLPVLLSGAITGFYLERDATINNIAQFTGIQFSLDSIFHSLTVASFCSYGLAGIINMMFLYSQNDASMQEKFSNYTNFVRYVLFFLALLASCTKYPYLASKWQFLGFNASNVINGISISMLDNFALFLLIHISFDTFYGSSFSHEKPIAPTFYCILQILATLSVLLLTFPTTKNLANYSVEENPSKPTLLGKLLKYGQHHNILFTSPTPDLQQSSIQKDVDVVSKKVEIVSNTL